MGMRIIAVALVMLVSPALAQQQPPPEVALQINNVVGQWAQMLVQQGRTIAELQAQLAVAQARIKELEAKTEPKKE